MMSYTDARGTVDYGNIDEFYLTDDHYWLSGDWGKLQIKSSAPSLDLQDARADSLCEHAYLPALRDSSVDRR